MKKMQKEYPQKKIRELREVEKKEIRKHVKGGDENVYKLANEFHCSTSQIAGVKAALNRGIKGK
ncbi:MAG TPA: hypothetical protein VK568_16855 [Thermodesulfobacteriota bacterium]|nr:hypothetical protein [Thermodesulfobacteriota bacterium]